MISSVGSSSASQLLSLLSKLASATSQSSSNAATTTAATASAFQQAVPGCNGMSPPPTAALSGALRFNEFVDAIDGISPRMLTERLRDLEEAKLVSRTVVPSTPPYVEYRLTRKGHELAPVIEALQQYAARSRITDHRSQGKSL